MIVTEGIVYAAFHIGNEGFAAVFNALVDGAGIRIVAFVIVHTAALFGDVFTCTVGTDVEGAGGRVVAFCIHSTFWWFGAITQNP